MANKHHYDLGLHMINELCNTSRHLSLVNELKTKETIRYLGTFKINLRQDEANFLMDLEWLNNISTLTRKEIQERMEEAEQMKRDRIVLQKDINQISKDINMTNYALSESGKELDEIEKSNMVRQEIQSILDEASKVAQSFETTSETEGEGDLAVTIIRISTQALSALWKIGSGIFHAVKTHKAYNRKIKQLVSVNKLFIGVWSEYVYRAGLKSGPQVARTFQAS